MRITAHFALRVWILKTEKMSHLLPPSQGYVFPGE